VRQAGEEGVPEGDPYSERLVKYIPGEALTFFLLFSSLEDPDDLLLGVVTLVCAVGAVLWALNRNAQLPSVEAQPPGLLTIYTVIAFAAWALGTSPNLQQLIGWPQQTCAVIMGCVAFLLPAVDEAISRRWVAPRRAVN
jgi:drug/metabolite transporter (DMT)-like permease